MSVAPGDERDGRAERLAGYVATQLGVGPDEVAIEDLEVPEGVGHSNETVLFTACHPGGRDELVLRIQPPGDGVFPDYDLGLQVTCMRAIGAGTAAPTPSVRWFEADPAVLGAPFYVMDRLAGVVPRDRMPYTLDGWLKDASADEQRRLHDASLVAMAEVHRADWRALGLEVLDRSAHGPPGMAQQLAWWIELVGWMAKGRPNATVDATTAWLRAQLPTDEPPTGITWGDARLSNIIYADFEPVGLLDWVMAALGPAEVDLAWFVFFRRFFADGLGVEDLAGFPDRAETVDRYAQLLGRDLGELFFYEVFAAWRHSAIMGRLADLYEATGEIPSGTDARVNNIASRMLAEMLDLPSPGEPGGPLG